MWHSALTMLIYAWISVCAWHREFKEVCIMPRAHPQSLAKGRCFMQGLLHLGRDVWFLFLSVSWEQTICLLKSILYSFLIYSLPWRSKKRLLFKQIQLLPRIFYEFKCFLSKKNNITNKTKNPQVPFSPTGKSKRSCTYFQISSGWGSQLMVWRGREIQATSAACHFSEWASFPLPDPAFVGVVIPSGQPPNPSSSSLQYPRDWTFILLSLKTSCPGLFLFNCTLS